MKYVKLIDNKTIEYAPKVKGSVINYNLNDELLKKDGYKLLKEVEIPQTSRTFHIEYEELKKDLEKKGYIFTSKRLFFLYKF